MSDLELIAKYKKWNNESFSILYNKYIDLIYKFVYLKVWNKEEAEDLTSEIFIKVFNSIMTFSAEYENSFKSWIYKIAYNKVIDYYRQKKEKVSLDESFEIWIVEDFAKNLDNKQKLQDVINFLKTIKKEQAEIIFMRIWYDLSYSEISHITWKTEDNCKKIVSRTLKKIVSELWTLILIFSLI